MTRKLDRTQIADVANFVSHEAPTQSTVAHPARTFELPPVLYALTACAYLCFIGLLATAFATNELLLPIAVMAILIVAGFGVPMLWTRMRPDNRDLALTWGQFRNRGIQTYTGRMSAGDATIQVLVLPTLILLWGVTFVTIAALTT
jgi:hypothetical protein